MVEQVIFKIDKELKAKAMRKAKEQGVSFSTVLKSAAQAYIQGEFEVGIVYNPKLIRDVREAQRDIKAGRIYKGDLDKLVKKVR